MPYHLGRDSRQLGEFDENEIRAGLQSGRFFPSDLAWAEGMPDWRPLSQVLPDLTSLVPSQAIAAAPAMPAEGGVFTPQPLRPAPSPTSAPLGHYGTGVMPTPGTAIASLILGILSFLTCYFGFLLVIPGLICGHMALSQIKARRSRYEGRGIALGWGDPLLHLDRPLRAGHHRHARLWSVRRFSRTSHTFLPMTEGQSLHRFIRSNFREQITTMPRTQGTNTTLEDF